MTAPALIYIAEKCHYCSRHVHPREIIPIGLGGAKMCHRCWDWHQKALAMFCGSHVWGCQECSRTVDQLMLLSPNGNVRLTVHVKDGIYQVLCQQCSDAYERKRLDLYGDTLYGHLKNLGAN